MCDSSSQDKRLVTLLSEYIHTSYVRHEPNTMIVTISRTSPF